jgi:uncharacterized protein (TIGR03086 family)
VESLVEHHRRACDEFLRVARAVPDDRWSAPTPCTEWDARAVVEHVIGFHDFLLLRPLGVRANRPRQGEAARWEATSTALFEALSGDGALDRELEMLSGEMSSPRRMLPTLTTEVLVHTWDLGVATGVDRLLEPDLTQLIGAWGRDPMWTPPQPQ